jgi:hypothetical protein
MKAVVKAWAIAITPSVYHIPGKFDGKTGTLSAMRQGDDGHWSHEGQ